MNFLPGRFPHSSRVFFVGLVLAFAAALTCPQPTLAASPTAKPLAGEPDEALWERFVQAWAMPKDTPAQLEAKLATFVDLKDIAEAHQYELFAFKTWNAIRIHYDILERPTEGRIHVTLGAFASSKRGNGGRSGSARGYPDRPP